MNLLGGGNSSTLSQSGGSGSLDMDEFSLLDPEFDAMLDGLKLQADEIGGNATQGQDVSKVLEQIIKGAEKSRGMEDASMGSQIGRALMGVGDSIAKSMFQDKERQKQIAVIPGDTGSNPQVLGGMRSEDVGQNILRQLGLV